MPRSKPKSSKTTRKTVTEEKNMKKKPTTKKETKKTPKTKKPRKSFKEAYTDTLVSHANSTMKIIFKNWKLFGLLLFFIVVCNIFFVGIMSEETYQTVQDSLDESYEMLKEGSVLGNFAKSGMLLVSTVTTGGLTSGMTEVQQIFMFIFFGIT